MPNNTFTRYDQAKQRLQMPLFYLKDAGLKAATDTVIIQKNKLIEKLIKSIQELNEKVATLTKKVK